VDAPEEIADLYRTLFERITLAYKRIDTEKKRREHIAEIDAAAAAEAVEQRSAEVFEEVEDRLAGKDFAGARAAAEALLDGEHAPGAQGYLAWITVAEAKNRPAVKAKALGLITQALKGNPRCGETYLNAARIAKVFGDDENAKKYLARAKALGVRPRKKKKA
jgi:hypothetical protein